MLRYMERSTIYYLKQKGWSKGFKKNKVSMSMWYTPNNNRLEGKHGTDG